MSKTKTTATQKPKVTSTFADLYKIDVNDYTEQKGGLTYLSWSWAWAWTKKHYPDATYSYYRNPETNLPYSYQVIFVLRCIFQCRANLYSYTKTVLYLLSLFSPFHCLFLLWQKKSSLVSYAL